MISWDPKNVSETSELLEPWFKSDFMARLNCMILFLLLGNQNPQLF